MKVRRYHFQQQLKTTKYCTYTFFFFLFWPPLGIWSSQGQESDLSHSPDLSCRCGNMGSLTHCARARIKPVSQRSQNAADPIAPQWEVLHTLKNG